MRKVLMLMTLVGVLAACGGDKAPTTTAGGGAAGGACSGGTDFVMAPANGDTTVDIKDVKFNPANVTIKVGQKVQFKNSDGFGHTSTGDGKEWDSKTIGPNANCTVTFNKAGTYPFHCEIHKQMKGTVVVS
jgi:plastocyanin